MARCGPLRPTGSADRLAGTVGGTSAGLGVQVAVLAVWQMDSSAAGDIGACFALCFMLLMSCTPGQSLLSMIVFC